MILVVAASVLVAALADRGPDGEWAAAMLGDHELAAPNLMSIETTDIPPRTALAGDATADAVSLAHGTLLGLRIELWPYAPLDERFWPLREGVTVYDGTYVVVRRPRSRPTGCRGVRTREIAIAPAASAWDDHSGGARRHLSFLAFRW